MRRWYSGPRGKKQHWERAIALYNMFYVLRTLCRLVAIIGE